MFHLLPNRKSRKWACNTLTLLALSVLFSSQGLAKPDEVTESAVNGCHYLGKVEASSGYGKNWGWQPIAKSRAVHRAENMGASHIVWDRFIPVGTFNGTAIARAYGCSN